MEIKKKKAFHIGLASIACILLMQSFNSFACYKQSLTEYFYGIFIFLGIPLLAAIIGLFTKNPLRALGACLFIAPWLIFAYYVDCIRPYTGGGASMIYIAVLLWGTLGSVFGAIITGIITGSLGIKIIQS